MSDNHNRPTPETERACVCMFCGAAFGYAGTTPDEATVRAACEHEAKCERNPYLLHIAKVERERDEARAAAAKQTERLAKACVALEKIKNYTPHDEVYFGTTSFFADIALNMVAKMETVEAGKGEG